MRCLFLHLSRTLCDALPCSTAQGTVKGLEDQLARLRQAQASSGQQAAALRERLRRLQNADARGRTYLQTSAGEVRLPSCQKNIPIIVGAQKTTSSKWSGWWQVVKPTNNCHPDLLGFDMYSFDSLEILSNTLHDNCRPLVQRMPP